MATGIQEHDIEEITPPNRTYLKGKWWALDWHSVLDMRSCSNHETYKQAREMALLYHADRVENGAEFTRWSREAYPHDYFVIFKNESESIIDGPFQKYDDAVREAKQCKKQLSDMIDKKDKGTIVELYVTYGWGGVAFEVNS